MALSCRETAHRRHEGTLMPNQETGRLSMDPANIVTEEKHDVQWCPRVGIRLGEPETGPTCAKRRFLALALQPRSVLTACRVSLQSPAQPRQPDTLSYPSRPLQPLCPRLCDSSLKIQLGHHPLQRGPVPPTPRRLAPPPPPAMCVPLRFTSAILHVWVPHQTAISL